MKQPKRSQSTSHSSGDQPREYALSRKAGLVSKPKDFDWFSRSVPCQIACPAGTNIPGYLAAVAKGDFSGAYRLNLEANVFPAILGRVCTRPCEPVCRHGKPGLGEPVAICFVKRSADDFMENHEPIVLPPHFPDSGKSIGVVGAGPAGLSAARELRRLGHQVTVYEKEARTGGLLYQGIPAFRLSRDIRDREIAQVQATGMHIQCGVEVGRDISLETLQHRHEALVLAVGALSPAVPEIPGTDWEGVSHGLPFLKEANGENPPDLGGRRVMVIGAGFTGVDCARIAVRLGALSVTMVCRRARSDLYVGEYELRQMEEEGIEVRYQLDPVAIEASANGHVAGVRFVKTEPGPRTADGRRGWTHLQDTEEHLECDMLLLATGQGIPPGWQSYREATPENVFVAGDLQLGPSTLIDSIASGKKVAMDVDTFLYGEPRLRAALKVTHTGQTHTGRTREMDAIPRQEQALLPLNERGLNDEVEKGLTRDQSQTEALRCYLCNTKFEIDNELCIYCDRCLKVTPVDGCIVKVSSLVFDEADRITGFIRSTGPQDYRRLHIDPSLCIRCGACVEVCPVDCISVQKVEAVTIPVKPRP